MVRSPRCTTNTHCSDVNAKGQNYKVALILPQHWAASLNHGVL